MGCAIQLWTTKKIRLECYPGTATVLGPNLPVDPYHHNLEFGDGVTQQFQNTLDASLVRRDIQISSRYGFLMYSAEHCACKSDHGVVCLDRT